MKVKAIGKTHILLILTASEAQLLGIPTESGCAMILRTHASFFPHTFFRNRRYRVKLPPQVIRLTDCSALLDLLEHLCRLELLLQCQLYSMTDGYAVIFHPTCRHFFRLRSLAGEYGYLRGNSYREAAFVREHGKLLSCDALREVGAYFHSMQK